MLSGNSAKRAGSGEPPVGLEPGEVLEGKYRIERLIGAGGMGIVFEATHLLLEQRVAIKLPRRDLVGREDGALRFLREARVAFGVKSEHVVRVLDLGLASTGEPFIAMEYLEGSTVAELLHSRGRLPFAEAAQLAMQAMRGVEAAHAVGLVHRDLKPSNLFAVVAPGSDVVIKVLDFGIAKPRPDTDDVGSATRNRGPLGSPAYMSPEQIRDEALDGRSDVWSLGVVLYELISGHLPFEAESPRAVIAKILVDPPVVSRTASGEVPAELERLIHRCLQKDRSGRPATVEELRRILAGIVAEGPLRLEAVPLPASSAGPSSALPAPGTAATLISAVPRHPALPPRGGRGRLHRAALAVALLAIGGAAAVTAHFRNADLGGSPLQPRSASTRREASAQITAPLDHRPVRVSAPEPVPLVAKKDSNELGLRKRASKRPSAAGDGLDIGRAIETRR